MLPRIWWVWRATSPSISLPVAGSWAAPLMPADKDYSRINQGRRELIDHILVSAALVHQVTSVETVIDQPLPSITADPNARLSAPSSDHAPVVATFSQ